MLFVASFSYRHSMTILGRYRHFCSSSSLSSNAIATQKRNFGTAIFQTNHFKDNSPRIAIPFRLIGGNAIRKHNRNNDDNQRSITFIKRYKNTSTHHGRKNKKLSHNKQKKKKKDKASNNNALETKVINPNDDHYEEEIKRVENNKFTPPIISFIHSTASPNAYISSCAAEDLNLNPKDLFTECRPPQNDDDDDEKQKQVVRIPPIFQRAQFEYRSPKKHFKYKLPTLPIPEVAVLGRSNVGKSSLLNALMSKKNSQRKGKQQQQTLARTSKTPGRTQQVNFFEMTSQHNQQPVAHLIDLPGYGYAKAPDAKVDKWQETTQDFLQQRRDDKFLQRVYLLLDGRHGSLNFDNAVMGWLDDALIPYTLVFTKGDSVSKPMKLRHVNDVAMRYDRQFQLINNNDDFHYNDEDNEHYDEPESIMQCPITFITSSKTGDGMAELMWAMDADFLRGREILNP